MQNEWKLPDEQWAQAWQWFNGAFQSKPEWKAESEAHYRMTVERYGLPTFIDSIDLMTPTLDLKAGDLPSVAKVAQYMGMASESKRARMVKRYVEEKDERNASERERANALNKLGHCAVLVARGMLTTHYTASMTEAQRIDRWTMPQEASEKKITGDRKAGTVMLSPLDVLINNWKRYGHLVNYTAEEYVGYWDRWMPFSVMNKFREGVGLEKIGEAA